MKNCVFQIDTIFVVYKQLSIPSFATVTTLESQRVQQFFVAGPRRDRLRTAGTPAGETLTRRGSASLNNVKVDNCGAFSAFSPHRHVIWT